MKRSITGLMLAITLLLVLSPLSSFAAPPDNVPVGAQEARLWGYTDGDKFKVRIGNESHELNLIGADAPEPDKGERGECFAQEASDRIKKLVPKKATIWLESDEKAQDGKDRLLRYVWIAGDDDAKPYMLNERLIKEGFASFKDDDDNSRYDARFRKAHDAAKKAQKGLWGICGGGHEPAPRCEDVSQELVDGIAQGFLPDANATFRGAQAVRSGDYEKVWFVGIELEGPGLDGDDQIAIFATNSLEPGGGLIMAVGGLAHEFTDWGHGEDTDAELSISDDGVSEVEACVRRALSSIDTAKDDDSPSETETENASFSGSGNATEQWSLSSGKYRVEAQCSTEAMNVYINDLAGNLVTWPVSKSLVGDDSSYEADIPNDGEYMSEVYCDGTWNIVFEEAS